MRLEIPFFRGTVPKVASRLLPPQNAEFAQDCLFEDGNLEPRRGNSVIGPGAIPLTGATTIFRWNTIWFSWDSVVNAILSPIANDVYDRVYFTGDGAPQVTSNLIATGGYAPNASYDLGVPAPDDKPTLALIDGGDDADLATDETRVYAYTYVTEYGEEGPPSLPSDPVVLDDPTVDGITVTVPIPVVNTQNITHKRIYRSVTSGSGTQYQFVAEIPLATTQYVDSLLTGSLGRVLDTENYEPPPATMAGLVMGANGIAAAFDGNEALFCEPYLPYAWPTQYRRSFDWEIVGVQPTTTGYVFCTKGMPYLVQGVHPNAMSERKIEIPQACSNGRSMVDMGEYVLYASPDGLVAISETTAQLVTEDIITRREWQSKYVPATIHAYRYNNLYVGFYGAAQDGGFVFDPKNGDITDISYYATAGFNRLEDDKLYLVLDDDSMYVWDNTGIEGSYTWRSKVWQTPDVSFSTLKVWTDSPADVGVKIWADGKLVMDLASMPQEAIRIGPGRGTRWQVELHGTAIVERVVLAQGMDEVAG